jgi:hypothetical protein
LLKGQCPKTSDDFLKGQDPKILNDFLCWLAGTRLCNSALTFI